ncbi:MAG: DUF2306 domain-containing protein [Cytophagales bacterium]
MNLLFSTFLVIHIASGAIALFSGLVSMASAKGKKSHRVAGNIFFWAMAGVFVSSVYMSLFKSNWFLLCVGFFSFYLTSSGYMALKVKSDAGARNFKRLYILVYWSGLLAGLVMLGLAAALFYNLSMFGTVPATFGLISISLGLLDYRILAAKADRKNSWVTNHALRMGGAFTATITAFIVVNIQIEQQWVLWLLPTAVVIPATRIILSKFKAQKAFM